MNTASLTPEHQAILAAWLRMHHLPPLGYICRNRETGFEPDPVYFSIMRRIWDLVLEGVPVDQVRATVNNDWNFRTPIRGRTGGKPLANSALYKMLRDPFYSGRLSYAGGLVPAPHPAMVTKDEFERVQEMLDRRRRCSVRGSSENTDHR